VAEPFGLDAQLSRAQAIDEAEARNLRLVLAAARWITGPGLVRPWCEGEQAARDQREQPHESQTRIHLEPPSCGTGRERWRAVSPGATPRGVREVLNVLEGPRPSGRSSGLRATTRFVSGPAQQFLRRSTTDRYSEESRF